jgi:hypothetical protein
VRAAAFTALLVAFTAHAQEPGPMRKQDFVPPIFAPGPSLADPDFESWLSAQKGAVKLPFTIWRKPKRVGAIGLPDVQPARVFRFSDGALGVPLDERLRQLCGDAEVCKVWLAGRFGESMPLPDPDPATVFNVHAVHEAVKGLGVLSASSVRGPECLAIRVLRPLHCARGAKACAKCKEAQSKPALPKLLDVCPHGDVARPTIETAGKGFRAYEVLQVFPDVAEAKAFAEKHGLTDVQL